MLQLIPTVQTPEREVKWEFEIVPLIGMKMNEWMADLVIIIKYIF